MTGIFLEIALRRVRGRLWRWSRLLRQPRYLVGTLIGAAYFIWLLTPRRGQEVELRGLTTTLEALGGPLQVVAAVILAASLSVAWLMLPSRPRLPLDEAEILTLTTAPLTRRQVLRYALIKSQLSIVLSVFILFVLTGRSAERLQLLPAYWLLLTVMDLHFKAVGMTKARVAALPSSQRNAAIAAGLGVLVVFWTIIARELRGAWAAVTAVSLSGTIRRTMRGRPVSRSAWMVARPESAWTTGSYTRLWA